MSISQRLRSATPSVFWPSSHPTGSCTHRSTALCQRASFDPTLFADTAELRLTLRRVFRDDGEAVAFWFDFTWVLADGTSASSTIVDIAELTEDGLIASLHIVYDTAPIRGDFEQATRNGKP